MYAKSLWNAKRLSIFALFLTVVFPSGARAQDEGEWANIGSDVGDMVAENLLSWIEGPLADEGLTINDNPRLQQPDPDTPVITIRLFVDAPFPASNKTIIIEIYPDGRVKITTIHHKITGDETVVEWRDDIIPDNAKRWLWGPPETHDLTGNPIDIWSEDAAVQEIKNRVQPIVEQRVYRNIADLIRALLDLLGALWRFLMM
jgi:hypothetical protein